MTPSGDAFGRIPALKDTCPLTVIQRSSDSLDSDTTQQEILEHETCDVGVQANLGFGCDKLVDRLKQEVFPYIGEVVQKKILQIIQEEAAANNKKPRVPRSSSEKKSLISSGTK